MNNPSSPGFDPEDPDHISKTQLKQQAHDLQQLGKTLVELTPNDLKLISMPEQLEDAVLAARKMNKRGALKRQLQFIGKVMRKIDVQQVQDSYDALQQRDQLANARFHRIEALRDKLIKEGDEALNEALDAVPNADRQHIRQLVRNAQKEQTQGKPPAAARALFQYLRETSDSE